jgi:ABC-type nickel/cobalt efflux system permease component RcnA
MHAAAGLTGGLLVVVFLAGLRHGFDIDHIAAITDITSAQTSRRRSLVLASIYMCGHALVLFGLGVAAVVLGAKLPSSIDAAIGRVIGATLLGLGIYVIYSIARHRSEARLQSRWMLLFTGVRRTIAWLHRDSLEHIEIDHAHPHGHGRGHNHGHPLDESGHSGRVSVATATHAHTHRHVVAVPADPFSEYGVLTTFVVGMIHGVGAETPSQILLFTTAAGVAGSFSGVTLVLAFVAGLFVGNTVLAVGASLGFAGGRRFPIAYAALAGLTATVSIWVGTSYLLGNPALLPHFLGGS